MMALLPTDSGYKKLQIPGSPEVPLPISENDIIDQGGRRSGYDRRQMRIDQEVDDQRKTVIDRRSGADRRTKWSYDPENPDERRNSFQINNGK